MLLIVQDKKLHQAYDSFPNGDVEEEERIIDKLVQELGLSLEFYKYLGCTDQRVPLGKEFGRFASNNLARQKYLTPLKKKYFNQIFKSHYAIDDYVILAKHD